MIKIILRFIIGVASITNPILSYAQTNYYFGPEKVIVKLDPLTNIPERELPFDRNFFIRVYLQEEFKPATAATLVEVIDKNEYNIRYRNAWVRSGTTSSGAPVYSAIKTSVAVSAGKQDYEGLTGYDIFVVEPLQPNRTYDIHLAHNMSKAQRTACVEALLIMHNNKGSITPDVRTIINSINTEKNNSGDLKLIDDRELNLYYDQIVKGQLQSLPAANMAQYRLALIESLNQPIIDPVSGTKDVFYKLKVISATGISTVAYKLETRARSQIQPDFGLVFYGLGGSGSVGINDKFYGVTPYVGVNYLFRQFDGDIKLSQLPKGHIDFKDLLSINAGLTMISLAKEGQRENLFKTFNPMMGLGIRLSSAVKFNTGVIAYKKVDENPLVGKTKPKLIGYTGISIDLRIRDVLGDIGKLLTAN